MRVGDLIYLDYQASTPVDERVKKAMQQCSDTYFANPHATQHTAGQQAATVVDKARTTIETIIGAEPEEVIFTSGATESNNHAIASILFDNASRDRKTVLISAIEHKCVKNAAYFYANKLGYNVKEIPVLSSGLIDLDAYQSLLSDDVVLVCIMAVNNEIGVIQDIKSLVEKAHNVGALFHCDAAQAPEAIDINVKEWGVDTLSLSGHKIYGPKGIGILYIKTLLQAQLPPFIHGGGQQGGARSGTLPTDLCVGMAEALKITVDEAVVNRSKLSMLSQKFIEQLNLSGIDYQINGDLKQRHPGNINVKFKGVIAPDLLEAIQPKISASTGSACNSEMVLPSHVLTALGLSVDEALSSIRFSLGRYSDEQQIVDAVNILKQQLNPI